MGTGVLGDWLDCYKSRENKNYYKSASDETSDESVPSVLVKDVSEGGNLVVKRLDQLHIVILVTSFARHFLNFFLVKCV